MCVFLREVAALLLSHAGMLSAESPAFLLVGGVCDPDQQAAIFRRDLSNLLRGYDHRSEALERWGQARRVRLGHIA